MFTKLCSGLLVAAVFALPGFARAEVAGSVIGYVPEGYVERDGGVAALALKSVVQVADTLRTGVNGRVEVLFSDDSSMKLGPNTVIEVAEFMPSGESAGFKANLSTGAARFITGKITEQNKEGFVIQTAEATIGIRGSIGIINAVDNMTQVQVIEGTIYVNGVQVPPGFQAFIDSTGMNVEQMSLEDFVSAAENWSSFNEASSGDGGESGQDGDSGVLDAFAETQGNTGNLEDVNISSEILVTQTNSNTGVISGGLTALGSYGGSGTFIFAFDLQSGVVSNAQMAGNFEYAPSAWGALALNSGTGFFDTVDGAFSIENFQGGFGGSAINGAGLNIGRTDGGGPLPALGDQLVGGWYVSSDLAQLSGDASGTRIE